MENKKVFFGVFLLSLAALAWEISLIRFFSIAQWYHFAFMLVSIALFGIAASGTFLAVKRVKDPLFFSAVSFSVAVLFAFFVTNNVIFDPFKAVLNPWHVLVLLVYYLVLGLPFFFFGIIIAHCLSEYQEIAGKIYFYNMFGSSLGAVASLFLLSYLQTKAVLVISLLGLFAAFFFTATRRKLVFGLIGVNLMLFFSPWTINVSKYKELSQALSVPGASLLNTRHNSFSRVDVVESSFARYAPGLSPTFLKTLPRQLGVMTDAGNMNAITKHEKLDFLDKLPSAIPYFLQENKKTLIINAGAGLDVLTALKNGASVVALAANPIIIDLLKHDYADYSGNIYNEAKVVWGEGRSYLRGKEFDIILVSLAGNVLSNAAGISGLSENYLLTVEAFKEYYKALSDDGILVITRWLSYPPKESLKLFSLALEIDKDAKKTALFRSWTTVTLLLAKKGLSPGVAEKIRLFCESNKFDLVYLPAEFIPNQHLVFKEPFYYNAVNNLLKDKEGFLKQYIFDVGPVTDDLPFYFNFFKISKLQELRRLIGNRWNPFLDSGFLLIVLLIQAIVLAVIFILAPLRQVKGKKLGPLVYFFAIGLSYLLIEIVLIQKFILFLGHVVFSSTAIIFSLLIFSSLGALSSQRVKKLPTLIFILFGLVIFYAYFTGFIIEQFIQVNLTLKMMLTVLLTAPLGFFMGFPFPLGIRMIPKELIPWSWAVNGSASVLAPILAVLIALFFGYNFVLLLAGVLYVVGFIALRPFPLTGQT